MADRYTMRAVWTRTGSRRHGAIEGKYLTLCGREHLGFIVPTTGAPTPPFTARVRDDTNTCGVCRREAERHDAP